MTTPLDDLNIHPSEDMVYGNTYVICTKAERDMLIEQGLIAGPEAVHVDSEAGRAIRTLRGCQGHQYERRFRITKVEMQPPDILCVEAEVAVSVPFIRSVISLGDDHERTEDDG